MWLGVCDVIKQKGEPSSVNIWNQSREPPDVDSWNSVLCLQASKQENNQANRHHNGAGATEKERGINVKQFSSLPWLMWEVQYVLPS